MSVHLKLTGVDKILERLQEMDGNVDDAARKTLQHTADRVTQELAAGIARHNRTGKTASQLRRNPRVEGSGSRFRAKVGFHLPKGLPARYINKGTPTNRPKDPFVDKALNKSRINKEMQQFLEEVVK